MWDDYDGFYQSILQIWTYHVKLVSLNLFSLSCCSSYLDSFPATWHKQKTKKYTKAKINNAIKNIIKPLLIYFSPLNSNGLLTELQYVKPFLNSILTYWSEWQDLNLRHHDIYIHRFLYHERNLSISSLTFREFLGSVDLEQNLPDPYFS